MKLKTTHAATLCLLVFAACASASAQTGQTADPSRRAAPPERRSETTADEDFDLSIAERRINERDFHAETAVGTDGDGGLNLKVGVAVSAGEINVLLRNVQGHVRFRANLEPVLRFLDARRGPPRQPPPAPPNTSP